MKIHAKLFGSTANGPGVRTVLWTQGCIGMDCPGCHNMLTHPADGPLAEGISPEELAYQLIRYSGKDTEGLTISGGEPAQQMVSIYALACSIHARRPDWSIGLFTGYTLSELQLGRYATYNWSPASDVARASLWDSMTDHLDFVVAGRYDHSRPVTPEMTKSRPNLKLCASANQTLKLYRRRYSYDSFADALELEVTIDDTGLVQVTGFDPKRGA